MTTTIPQPADGIAWVTGASSGIGRELAIQLAAAGWRVAISARRAPELEALAAEHSGMIAAPLDITDTDAVNATVARIEAQSGAKIVLAILNAGTYLRDTADTFDLAKFKTQIDVNLTGTANCLAAILPGMLAARRGQIGIVASLAGLAGLPGAVTYSTTKAGLIAMAQSLKFDGDRHNIAISAICPGFVKTPLTAKNEFEMPYLMEVEEAGKVILDGLKANRFLIAFPAQLAWPLKILRALPAPIYFYALAKSTKW
jgi:NAD(P)-dependent dehydrogenase (short-subunit alcohol dehydrogenase family)